MKRIGAIICMAVLIVTMTAAVCFGGDSALKLENTYPKDEQKNTTKENMCVKLNFNNEMGNEASEKANEGCFSIKGEDGKEIPIKIFYNPKDTKQVMVVADTTTGKKLDIKDDTDYTLYISGDVIDNEGNALGADTKVRFKTMNQGQSTTIYMIMMVVMFGGMFFFSSRQMKKQREEDNERPAKEEAFNPYKEAKKTGKPVEEIIAAHEKEVAKKKAREAKKAAHAKTEEYEEDNGNYKVKAAKTVASGGSTFVTGRKAAAEAKKAAAAKQAQKKANAKKKKK